MTQVYAIDSGYSGRNPLRFNTPPRAMVHASSARDLKAWFAKWGGFCVPVGHTPEQYHDSWNVIQVHPMVCGGVDPRSDD